jgi:hypothetical protein
VRPIFRPAEASLLRIRASVELAALALRSKALMERLACAKAADPVNLAASLSALSLPSRPIKRLCKAISGARKGSLFLSLDSFSGSLRLASQ